MYAIIDIETTGGSPRIEKIIEIAVYIHDGEKITNEFVSLINPERGIPPFITQMTGISNEMVATAPKFYEIAKKIFALTEGKIFVAHNATFDYNFIKEEYKNLGFNFKREQLCTIKLSRRLIQGKKSYSLGKLCDDLSIKINGRHRAAGDALATVKLFELLLKIDQKNISGKSAIDKYALKGVHPNITRETIAALPQEPGVYYFFDKNRELIYIGKSIDIRKRVVTHLGNEKSQRSMEMKDRIAEINFEVTGSELIALLLESAEIKKHMPIYNKQQRRSIFNNGLFLYTDQNGYHRIMIDKTRRNETPLIAFSALSEAKSYLFKVVEEYQLCQKLCGLYDMAGACFHHSIKQCNGACIQKETPDDYNARVKLFTDFVSYDTENLLIIDKGRNENEKAIVKIEKGKYKGFGYFQPELIGDQIQQVAESISNYPDNKDIKQIIKLFLRKGKVEKVIPF